MILFQEFIRVGTVILVPDGKRVNKVQVDFDDFNGMGHNRENLEWIDPKVFPMVPEVGERIRFRIEPTIVGVEQIK